MQDQYYYEIKDTILHVMVFICLGMPFLMFCQETAQNMTFSLQDGNELNRNQKVKPELPWFVRRIKASVGLFIPINNTIIEVGSANGDYGTTIDLEDDLGFRKSTNTFLADLQWRISRRSQFEISYFYLNRTTSRTLKRTIEFGDHTYPVDAAVESFFKTSIFRVSYGYAFFVDPKYEFGLMIGAHIIQSEVGISLLGATVGLSYKDEYNFTAPLPDIGIWGGYAISDRFAAKGNVSYFALKINNIDGKVTSGDFSVLYKVIENLHFSLSYTGLNFRVDVEKEKGQGYFKWGYNGPLITASYAFGKKKPF
ncbi:hypothetical protein CLU81_5150 [Flavobacterium sp. 9]|uniref:hypothetical protein n=1 Tax=Flavobacterium sp. 9 TaxID=2035198 RepID=UPI000C17A453|nr:hypothetical protein [Flavobacterium sp. 9]PIF34499.1 hypothetical protein CLU81_5150 [Flavobacterium sp. 9]